MAGNYCVLGAGQVKAKIGVQNVFEVTLPTPCSQAPHGKMTINGVDYALAFEGAQSVVVESLEDGRRKLSLASAPSVKYCGLRGAAWVVSDSVCWPCTVSSFETVNEKTFAVLADSLPCSLPKGESITLQFGYFRASLPVQNEKRKDCLLQIDWEPIEFGGDQERSLTFLVDYVHQVFCTGVTEQDLRRYCFTLNASPSSDAGFSPAIQAGEDDLIFELRLQLADKGLTEDEIPASSVMRQAHILFAAAHLFRISDRDTYTALQSQAKASVEAALRKIWIDEDGDCEPNEPVQNLAGRRGSDLRFGKRKRP